MTMLSNAVEPIELGRSERVLIALETHASQIAAHAQREPDPHLAVAIENAAAQVRAIRAP